MAESEILGPATPLSRRLLRIPRETPPEHVWPSQEQEIRAILALAPARAGALVCAVEGHLSHAGTKTPAPALWTLIHQGLRDLRLWCRGYEAAMREVSE